MQQAVVRGSFPWSFHLLGGKSACKQPAVELEGTAAISVVRDTGAGRLGDNKFEPGLAVRAYFNR